MYYYWRKYAIRWWGYLVIWNNKEFTYDTAMEVEEL